jgi:hypothetical protein
MERAAVLINKLQEQLANGSSAQNMLVTLQMLQFELTNKLKQTNGQTNAHVAVMVPNTVVFNHTESTANTSYKPVPKPDTEPVPQPDPDEEPTVAPEPHPGPHPGPRPEPEPLPIPPLVEAKPWQNLPAQSDNGPWPMDPLREVPTLAHQDKIFYELNEAMQENDGSLNDKLKEDKVERGAVLQETPVRDLKKAISINERHRFINELFRGDETMYERSIKTINGFNIYAEAEYWIQRELKLKVGWDTNSETVKIFDQLIKRRFL